MVLGGTSKDHSPGTYGLSSSSVDGVLVGQEKGSARTDAGRHMLELPTTH